MWDWGSGLLTITSRDGHDRVQVAAIGEIDRDTVATLADTLTIELDRYSAPAVLCVDLGEVTFLAAAGVNALLVGRRYAYRRGVSYQVVNAAGIALCVLRALELDSVLLSPSL
ncbi:STAS domain-containing protein [Actinoplanes xinjiangensis]|uniref:STAS domain-containing protein n=1 Tax=Actinoplanes xinjiangensis TaxID=512350 RepID=UPI003416CC21